MRSQTLLQRGEDTFSLLEEWFLLNLKNLVWLGHDLKPFDRTLLVETTDRVADLVSVVSSSLFGFFFLQLNCLLQPILFHLS